MSKSPWGKIGAWAEQAEEEEREEAAKAAAMAASVPAVQPQDFPDLKVAVVTAKQQKKKNNKVSLQVFHSPSTYAVGLTPEEMLRLPSRPREHSSADEMPYGGGRLGGGFSNYGNRSSGPPSGRSRDGGGFEGGTRGDFRRPYGGSEDEPRRGQRPDVDQTSRADEVDNWASMKKSLPSYTSGPGGGPGPRPSRYAALGGGSDSGGPSRANEVDNWASTKKPIPPPSTRSYNVRPGAGDSRPEPDRWIRDGDHERPSLSLNVSKGEDGGGVVKVNKPNPFGAARPREEVLAEKGLDWKKLDMEIEAKKPLSRPTSSHSSRPGSSQSIRSEGQALQGTGEGLAMQRPKTNPFGEARPREVLLEEKGLDWRKIDSKLDHRHVERPETDEEKNLRKEIEHLKHEKTQKAAEDQSSLHEIILQKERDLELLIQDLDAKIRLGQKPGGRPRSGAGRFSGPAEMIAFHTGVHGGHRVGDVMERPGSGPGRFSGPAEMIAFHTGVYGGHRVGDFTERPRSRGTGDAWQRSADDRRPSQYGRGRGYSGGGDMDRSLTGVRW